MNNRLGEGQRQKLGLLARESGSAERMALIENAMEEKRMHRTAVRWEKPMPSGVDRTSRGREEVRLTPRVRLAPGVTVSFTVRETDTGKEIQSAVWNTSSPRWPLESQ